MSIEYLNQVVDFKRPKIDGYKLRGFVLDYSDSLTLLNVLDDNFYLNGFTVIRNSDIAGYRAYDKDDYFLNMALRLKAIKPMRKPKIDLDNWATVLRTVQERFPLLTIHREAISSNVCYVGKLVSITEKTFTLYDIDPDANWDRPHLRKLADLTKVDFGGGYEDALWRVAKEENRIPEKVI
ncbi:MAG TPA: hypothetical protein PLD20_28585 [Blastocatellia bacterium]|nr:hypothetical protein [Blastocatellia bacterium]HMV84229.1 hypothetical protein [Blastocatellia bacterium]HMX26997.1 hypothetical protein [Blastocatellia bacterium]HMY72482.1 hypothetical protein [Blastocatellia bacterium]HMZ21924.1 hypothetical protein [Blastocatellia bacterium]